MHFYQILRLWLSGHAIERGLPNIPGEGGTPYKGGSAQKGTFFRLQVYKRVGISSVEVHDRLGKSVISVCKRTKKG